MTMDVKKILKNSKGQALFEFLLFLPLMLVLYVMTLSFMDAINGSINQQKITRSYFFSRLKVNSTVPAPSHLGNLDSISETGMVAFGWQESSVGETPVSTCYKVQSPTPSVQADDCKQGYSEPTTQNIRVQTVFGICGQTIDGVNSGLYRQSLNSATYASCLAR